MIGHDEPAMNYYEVLGVSSDATDDEIKKAFRGLGPQVPPRREPRRPRRGRTLQGDQRGVRDAVRSRAAPALRHVRSGRRERGTVRRRAARSTPARSGSTTCSTRSSAAVAVRAGGPGGAARGPDAETRAGSHARRRRARRAQDARPADARRVRDAARAAGCAPGTHPDRCPTCDGSGEVRQVRRSLLGQIVTAGPCSACGGDRPDHPESVRRLRRRGPRQRDDARSRSTSRPASTTASSCGSPGAVRPRRVAVRPAISTSRCASPATPTLERRGDELWYQLPVSIVQAALGTQVEITTLDGAREIDVAAGTQPGALHPPARSRRAVAAHEAPRRPRRRDPRRGADATERRGSRVARAVRRAPRREGELGARRSARTHPVRVQAVNARPAREPADAMQLRTCSSMRSTTGARSPVTTATISSAYAAHAGRDRHRGRRFRRVADVRGRRGRATASSPRARAGDLCRPRAEPPGRVRSRSR